MALRMELGIPPTGRLLMELREEVRDLLEEPSSRQWDRRRQRFREPGLGARGRGGSSTVSHLRQGSPSVKALLGRWPFTEITPQFISRRAWRDLPNLKLLSTHMNNGLNLPLLAQPCAQQHFSAKGHMMKQIQLWFLSF